MFASITIFSASLSLLVGVLAFLIGAVYFVSTKSKVPDPARKLRYRLSSYLEEDDEDDAYRSTQTTPRQWCTWRCSSFNEDFPGRSQGSGLDSLVEDTKLIGGSPRHVPPLRGPAGMTLAFRVYAPPKVDKEIPKVDLVGALEFVRTGKVRTFVPLGAKRLLVVNFRAMTLEVYMPKQGKHRHQHKHGKEVPRNSSALKSSAYSSRVTNLDKDIFAMRESTPMAGDLQGGRHRLKQSGITISTRNLVTPNGVDSNMEESNEDEYAWDTHDFEKKPIVCHKLHELVSISALPPRHGGSIEIMYKDQNDGKYNNAPVKTTKQNLNTGKSKETTIHKRPSLIKGEKSGKNLLGVTRRSSKSNDHNSLQDGSARSESDEIEKWLGEFDQDNAGVATHQPDLSSDTPSISYPEDDGRMDYTEPTVLVDDGLSAVAVGLSDDITSRNLPCRLSSTAAPATNMSLNNTPTDDDYDHNDIVVPMATELRDEFVFVNARDALEFQRVCMALRTCGREIIHLYDTLEAIQATSEAHFPELLNPEEEALQRKKMKQVDQHDNRGKKSCHIPNFAPAGVAFDDAWRCLSDIPGVRDGLNQLHQYLKKSTLKEDDIIAEAGAENDTDKSADGSDKNKSSEGSDNEEVQLRRQLANYYRENRALLGIVDFFSLFLPPLSPNSPAAPLYTPCAASELTLIEEFDGERSGIESHNQRLRIASALSRLVGRAALYVKEYAWAKIVVRDGWHLNALNNNVNVGGENSVTSNENATNGSNGGGNLDSNSPSEEGTTTKSGEKLSYRLAFDTESKNWLNDSGLQNQFYETTVGRDVTPLIRWAKSASALGTSRYQAYSLVGCHVFRLPPSTENSTKKFWLRPDLDPLESIPSLRRVVEKYPESQFIAISHFRQEVAIYFLYVRCLPVGVDEAFDKTMNRFINSEDRDDMLQIAFQLCPGQNWSSFTKNISRAIVLALLRIWMRGKMSLPFSLIKKGKRERISFPSILVSELALCKHFGGAIQTNPDMPKNYVAFSIHLSVENGPTFMSKLLLQSAQSSRLGILKSCTADMHFVLRARFHDEFPERVMTAIRLVHVDLHRVALPLDFCERDCSNHLCEDALEDAPNKTAVSNDGWLTRLLRFGRDDKKKDALESNAEISSNERNNELYSSSIDAIYSILDGVTVACPMKSDHLAIAEDQTSECNMVARKNVLDDITRSDVERYVIACGNDLECTAVRMVESAAWRACAFPIDTRVCKIELRSGQFFQQGKDKDNNPIFYFRNMLKGVWRHDVDATVLSVLHRLETFLSQRPGAKVTVIILLGLEILKDSDDADKDSAKRKEQNYHVHSNLLLVHRLIGILSRHYPERLAKALVVTSSGWTKTLIGSRGIKSYVTSQATRGRIQVLTSLDDLKKYVHRSELVTFAGGKAEVDVSAAYQCASRWGEMHW